MIDWMINYLKWQCILAVLTILIIGIFWFIVLYKNRKNR